MDESKPVNMDEQIKLIERQKEIGAEIEHKRAKAVKYGSKRTKDRFERILADIEDLWSEFVINDADLNEAAARESSLLEQPYFKQSKKLAIEEIRQKAITFISSHYPDLIAEGSAGASTSGIAKPKATENEEESESDGNTSDDSTDDAKNINNTNSSDAANIALLKISEVLASQQNFQQLLQQQLQQQMKALMDENFGKSEGLKAPRVDIPTFTGELTLYKSFKDTFLTVTNKSKMSNLEKLTLLKSKVSNIAQEYISHITIAEENYNKAWDILDNRFFDPVAIISTQVDLILDMAEIPPNNVRAMEKALNTIQGVANSFELLNICPNQVVMVRAIIRKLNDEASGELTRFVGNHKEFPSYQKIVDFFIYYLSILRAKARKEENVSTSKIVEKKKDNKKDHPHQSKCFTTQSNNNYHCFICYGTHLAPMCEKLAESENPVELLKHFNVCINCAGHKYNKKRPCNRKVTCDICKENHITILHGKIVDNQQTTRSFLCEELGNQVILPTAVAKIFGNNAVLERRMLIDTCSQASYIEVNTLKALNLPKFPCHVSILGVGGEITGKVQAMTKFKIQTRYPTPEIIEIEAYVVKKVTNDFPSLPTKLQSTTDVIENLADSYFGKPSHVPVLLGANVASQIFLQGTKIVGGLLLQNTKFGWIITGSVKETNIPLKGCVSAHVSKVESEILPIDILSNFEVDLKQFWDMPVVKEDVELMEKEVCEEIFNTKFTRTEEGRYVVPIPWKVDSPKLGNSFDTALKCYLSQERRLSKNNEHKQLSDEFMKDYIKMGHMTLVPQNLRCVKDGTTYYIPYHSILRKDAVTTKLRNVFNASAKSSSGISLNATIHSGPKLQTKIFDIITRLRQFKFMYSSDITKMYRQILLLPEDREKLRILYREHAHLPLQEYYLNTVTYGLDCAPWQAIRTIHQVANDHSPSEYINWIIKNAFYMDDLYHGADSVEECVKQIDDITFTLNQGQLPLTKWMSNDPAVLKNVEMDSRLESYVKLNSDDVMIKTLGIRYFPNKDMFGFKVEPFNNVKFTKRGLLSISASLFDPLGWILPIIMMFRILIQKIWAEDVNWDDNISSSLKTKFQSCIESLSQIEEIRINRWMRCSKTDNIELIGFSDASGDGMAAVLYSRIKQGNEFVITLIASKGKVTPLKTKLNKESNLCTIPKMELEAVLILSDLITEVKNCLENINPSILVYTDSQVALAWIRKKDEVDNKFVKRRVTKIKKVLHPGMVHYVKSSENPADAASRGLTATDFIRNKDLWLNGPSWMQNETLPLTPFEDSLICNTSTIQVDQNNFILELTERFSSWDKLIGCVVTILLWLQVIKNKASGKHKGGCKFSKSADCYWKARMIIIKLHQNYFFNKEIMIIQKDKLLPKHHWMKSLCPFLDSSGILRVGGRISRSNISESQKHPILIAKGHLARIIIRDTHFNNGHAATTLTDGILKQTYWVVNSKRIIKSVIQNCNICFRFKARVIQPQMSDLPIERISPGPIFENTAVDFCGPFLIKPSRLKFEKIIKAWIAVFVCMATKLVHLEICLDLSAENFLAAFERFTSRRSTPKTIMSDNGTNFVAANKLLSHQLQLLVRKGSESLAIQEIKWKFIPPGSPHFGGLHEACVKSFKYFLKRMTRVENITYEEFSTLICRIECLLNSRPLFPLSNDPNDELVLTPGHFAVQKSLKAPVSTFVPRSPIPISRRWVQIQELQNDFWNRFLRDYLSTQQKRYKWIYPRRNLQVDDVVIIKDHLSHPLDWPLGKIVKCYPDEKGVVRKVDLQSKNKSVLHRAVNKLIPVPSEDDEQKEKESRRKSQRFISPRSLINMFTMTLICLSFTVDSTKAISIEELTPGINVKLLEKDVSIKMFDVKFVLRTNINIKEDFNQMDSELDRFNEFCNSLLTGKFENITTHCNERYKALLEQLNLSKSNIMGSYGTEKRRRGLFSKIAMSTVLKKAAPYTAMAAAYGWQEYENWKLKKELNNVENKFNKVSFILLNLTESEHNAVHEQLDSLVEQQKCLILEAELNSYAEEIQTFISSMIARHNDFVNLYPLEELKSFVQQLNNPTSIARIPTLRNPESIFHVHPKKKFLKDDLVHIEYNIPLVKPETFRKYVIISTPNISNQCFILDNQDLVQVVVTNQDNSSYFFPQTNEEVIPTVYENYNEGILVQ